MGWNSALEGQVLTEVAEEISTPQSHAHEEALRVQLSGKAIRRVEMENSGGTIELLVLPLIKGTDRTGALVLLQNVTELRRRERELVTKDATIREIHHRVKNNLQTVSALLRLQARRIDDPAASAALNEAVRRIASIALVHETLSSGTDASVAFDDVLDRLVSHSLELSSRMNELAITRSGELGSLDSVVATPLSLVVTELIHNALEHGLEKGGSTLEILLERSATSATISIIDNGVGLPEGFDLATSSNLGLQIVRTLTENELKGTLVLESTERGTTARLNFPL
jgi:two-component sensor histidine kinase